MPGHEAYVLAASAAEIAPHWRPLTVVPDLTWSALFALLIPAALLIGLSQLSSRQRASLALPVIILIFASGILGLAQVTGGSDSMLRWYGGNPDRSAIGFLANRNHQALMLACALPVLAALGAAPRGNDNRKASYRWGLLGVAAFIVLMLPATGSRAGLILGGVSALLAALIVAPKLKSDLMKMRKRKRKAFIGGGFAAVFAFAIIFIFLGKNQAFSRIANLDVMSDQRVRAFPIVIKITKDFFPFGAGFGTFDPVFRHYEPFHLLKLTYFNEAHNDIVQLVLEGGVAAPILLLLFVGWWVIATFKAWRSPESPQALVARAGSAIVLLCILASIVDYPLRTPLILSIFTVAAVWMLSPSPGQGGASSH